MKKNESEDVPPSFEETRAELLAGLERAHELISEAKQVIGAKQKAEPQPPNPAR